MTTTVQPSHSRGNFKNISIQIGSAITTLLLNCHVLDLSQRSIGGETPPQSPGNLVYSSFRAKKSATSMETHWEEEPLVAGRHSHSK